VQKPQLRFLPQAQNDSAGIAAALSRLAKNTKGNSRVNKAVFLTKRVNSGFYAGQ
jgi:hypothetical protein